MAREGRKGGFRELPHTADLRVEIYGTGLEDLFWNAAECLYALMGLEEERGPGREEAGEEIRITAADPEEALVRFLSELLYRAEVEGERIRVTREGMTVRRIDGEEKGWEVIARGGWEKIPPGQGEGGREIKAVTYHEAGIRRDAAGLTATLVFDT